MNQDQNVIANELFWLELINENHASQFLGLSPRTLQSFRYRGTGPKYIRLSSRCIRYRRFDLKEWSDSHIRSNTSEG